jgi:hypothetical protein
LNIKQKRISEGFPIFSVEIEKNGTFMTYPILFAYMRTRKKENYKAIFQVRKKLNITGEEALLNEFMPFLEELKGFRISVPLRGSVNGFRISDHLQG